MGSDGSVAVSDQRVILGDCVEVMGRMEAGSVDAIVCDPPYGLEFMGREWDSLGGDARMRKPGIGDRPSEWPSFGGSEFGGANPTCATCGGRARGKKRCACEAPDWRVKGKPLGEALRVDGDDRLHGYVADTGFKDFTLPRQRQRNVKCPDCEKYVYDHPGRRCECGGVGRLQAHSMQEWHFRWAVEALRVLKPGGHLLAFGGTRTYHRLTCALEDAGFEIRDSILAWGYGSGFPKSLDVSKAITKRLDVGLVREIKLWLASEFERCGKTKAAINRECEFTASDYLKTDPGNDAGGRATWHLLLPYGPKWERLKQVVGFDGRYDADIAELGAIAGQRDAKKDTQYVYGKFSGVVTEYELSDLAAPWEGWGTALKPGFEPVVVARKPLQGTVASNVLAFGTGALNIDGCRLGSEPRLTGTVGDHVESGGNVYGRDGREHRQQGWDEKQREAGLGRWPANVVLVHHEDCARVGTKQVVGSNFMGHDEGRKNAVYGDDHRARPPGGYASEDGLEEVEEWECVEGCPVRQLDEQSGERTSGTRAAGSYTSQGRAAYGEFAENDRAELAGSTGGASRFFYSAKAARGEREAGLFGVVACAKCGELESRTHTACTVCGGMNTSEHSFEGDDGELVEGPCVPREASCIRCDHPTVKPVEVMRWLIRLVTPPGGVVLDPFAGSGTTLCAAAVDGVAAVGVEQDERSEEITRARVAFWREHGQGFLAKDRAAVARARGEEPVAPKDQLVLDLSVLGRGTAAT